jgi:cell division protein FtsI (penicillin-binding protein 3)
MRTGTAVGLDGRSVRWIRIRVGLLTMALVPMFATMAYRAFKLQVVEGPKLVQLAQEQYLEEAELPPRRGQVFDRNGSALAATVDVDSVSADPTQLPQTTAARAPLAKALNLDPKELDRRLAKGKHFAWLKRGATPDEIVATKALALPSLACIKEARRFYPQKELAANIVGFSGIDGEGLEGIELAFNSVLKGKPASVDIIRDAQHHNVFSEGRLDDSDLSGASVTLTIDRNIQHIAELSVARVVQKTSCQSAMAIVMDPATGEVLAMASAPTFNPNDPQGSQRAFMRNRPVVDSFEPGSTVKAFTMAAALQEGVVHPNDPINCEMGHYAIGTRVVHDHEPIGTIPATKVITVSSNVGAAKIAEKLGREKLGAYFRAFGLGERTGLGLPGEVKGSIPYPRADIQLATQAFGQGMTASGLQLVAGYAAIANGGTLMRPILVKKVVDPDGVVLESHGPEPVRRVISQATAQMVTDMLKTVPTKEGTAVKAGMTDYEVAGKTGTSQKVDPETGTYSADRRTASFIGFVPADAPRLVIAVIIDEPKGDKYGGLVAAPAFREIAEQALPLLGVQPRVRQALVATAAPAQGPVAELKQAMSEDDDREDGVSDDGDDAEPGQKAPKVAVPDLTNLGARAVAQALGQADLEPALSGSGRAVSQTPAPGAVVARGTRVTVKLESRL